MSFCSPSPVLPNVPHHTSTESPHPAVVPRSSTGGGGSSDHPVYCTVPTLGPGPSAQVMASPGIYVPPPASGRTIGSTTGARRVPEELPGRWGSTRRRVVTVICTTAYSHLLTLRVASVLGVDSADGGRDGVGPETVGSGLWGWRGGPRVQSTSSVNFCGANATPAPSTRPGTSA